MGIGSIKARPAAIRDPSRRTPPSPACYCRGMSVSDYHRLMALEARLAAVEAMVADTRQGAAAQRIVL